VRAAPSFLALALLAPGCASVPSPLVPAPRLVSVGAPSRGLLRGGVELSEYGPGYERFRHQRRSHYGTPALVNAISYAAAMSWPGPEAPPLLVGDLSARGGGQIAGHRSHRSGRDADLLFFFTTPGGVPVRSPGFLRVGADGIAPPARAPGSRYYRLDVARTWSFARALITCPHAEVVWLFVSEPVEALLLAHARALGEDPALLARAESVMQQPSDGAPHDDHFHLRVACSPDDATAGCVDGGPAWPWLARAAAPSAGGGGDALGVFAFDGD
jgi:penicillin-insensitive murein DD-endopeptidase